MAFLRISAAAAAITYLGWRLLFTWQGANPVMFFLLISAEVFGMVRLWIEISLLGEPRPAIDDPESGPAPDADIVVVVTDEPASEVRTAVLSARLVRGYGRLIVVDRDDRPDVVELTKRLGIERVSCSVETDLGSLVNTALDRCRSLLALLVPADVVVMPDVLDVSAGVFADPKLAVVVCRIESTNAAHAVDFGGYGEDRVRDQLMVDRLESVGGLPWWSGMSLVRREAIVHVGGMAEGRQGITLATGVRLQADGWKIADVAVVVARRLASWSDDRHLHRWSRDLHERLSVLVDPAAPRRNDYATLTSRRVYRLADIYVGRAIQRLVLFGILFATMYSSSLPLVADPRVLVSLWGTWMGLSILLRRRATRAVGFVPWITNDLRLMATDLAVAWRALPGRDLIPELVDRPPGRAARRVLFLALQFGLGFSLALFGLGIVRPSHGDFASLAALGITLWLFVMSLQARSALRLRQVRQTFRTFEELDVFASESRMGVIGMSPFGIDVVSSSALKEGSKLRLAFGLPQPTGSIERIEVSTTVRRSARDGSHHVAYLSFAQLSDDQMDRITEYCSVMAGLRTLRSGGAFLEQGLTAMATSPVQSEVAELG